MSHIEYGARMQGPGGSDRTGCTGNPIPGFLGIFLLGTFCVLMAGTTWAASAFTSVVETSHNLLPGADRSQEVCRACHLDDPAPSLPGLSGGDEPISPASRLKPHWNPNAEDHPYLLIQTIWDLPDLSDRKPFGPSSACLSCHDGALGPDVHGESEVEAALTTARTRTLDHPTAVRYPRQPDGPFVTEVPLPQKQRYWSIANRTLEGVQMPTGPISRYFQKSDGSAAVVRTSGGILHCDSCHNPHVDRHDSYLRVTPRDLCFVCHDR